ncbi:MAG: rubrerythrin family protein, partial [Promethearchaeota archaeon]
MKETVKKLMQAFVYESQARNRYELYSKTAKNEGLMLFSKFFEEIADQERENATWIYLLLQRLKKDEIFENLKVEIESTTGYGTTIENLNFAIKEEAFEFREMYPKLAQIAKEEGYSEIAKKIKDIVKIERTQFNRLHM